MNEEDSVAGDEAQLKEEEVEVEPPPLISTDDGTNDLLVCVDYNKIMVSMDDAIDVRLME